MGFPPYFLSAQLDGIKRIHDPSDWERTEGIVGLALNVSVWITAVILDIYILAYEFHTKGTNAHTLQTAAMVTLAIAAGTIVLFTLLGVLTDNSFSSTGNGDANFLPPFASSLISGNLKTTTVFSVLLITFDVILVPETEANNVVLDLLAAQVALKIFGTSLALNNQRLRGYAPKQSVFAVA